MTFYSRKATASELVARFIPQWAEGARMQECLRAGCATPDTCLLDGCTRIAWGKLVRRYVAQAKGEAAE